LAINTMGKYSKLLFLIALFLGCDKNGIDKNCTTLDFFSEYPSRNFNMGYSTWIYAPNEQAKKDTYQFVERNLLSVGKLR